MITRRALLCGTSAALLSTRTAAAQRTERSYRIGLLTLGAPGPPPAPGVAFRGRLRDLGYVEGRNVTFLMRFADGRAERLPALAAELVADKADVIVVAGPAPIQAAKAATQAIPIVMLAGSSDPVAEGLVKSLARPGTNITGLTYAVSGERFGKQMEIFKDALPRLGQIGILWDLDREIFERQWAAALREAGTRLAVEVLPPTSIRSGADVPAAFATFKRQRADGALVVSGGVAFQLRKQIAQIAIHDRLPTMAAFKEFTEAGALASYGPNIIELYRRGADFVDKILKGAKPAELPVEQPPTYELAINMATAKALNLAIPPTVLVRADHVIE